MARITIGERLLSGPLSPRPRGIRVEIGLLYSHYRRDSCLGTFNFADRAESVAQIRTRRPPTSYLLGYGFG
jgi:hypothetical protein